MTTPGKTALITGITGQDGGYLSRLLLQKEYRVIGVCRSIDPVAMAGLRYLRVEDQINLRVSDLMDARNVAELLESAAPDEVYNLAAASSVARSFVDPRGVVEFNCISVLNLLEAIRTCRPTVRFYQASSSEMYAGTVARPITRDSRIEPLSPYGCSKAAAHCLTGMYRSCYGTFAVSGILFNHESILRAESFFVKKVIRSGLRIRNGAQDYMTLGNLDVRRDIGLAENYVQAMWLMLQQQVPKDYVVCSGMSISLHDIVDRVIKRLGLDAGVVRIQREFFRPTDAADIYGDPGPARADLGWSYDLTPLDAIDRLIDEEIAVQAG